MLSGLPASPIKVEGGEAIGDGLKYNNTLRVLTLSSENRIVIVWQAQFWKKLWLWWTGCEVGDGGMRPICEALKTNTGLTDLNICCHLLIVFSWFCFFVFKRFFLQLTKLQYKALNGLAKCWKQTVHWKSFNLQACDTHIYIHIYIYIYI